MEPVMLGNMDTVTVSADALGSGDIITASLAIARAGVSFAYFEADGLTPVAWTEGTATPSVPEPSTFWLVTAALIVTCVVRSAIKNSRAIAAQSGEHE